MKKFLKIFIIMATFPILVRAENLNVDKVKPCKEIEKACLDAGFTKTGHKMKKGLTKDCINPILKNRPAVGVVVSSETIEACKKNKTRRFQKKIIKAKSSTNN